MVQGTGENEKKWLKELASHASLLNGAYFKHIAITLNWMELNMWQL